jgi:protein-export membrane protein SecD
MDNKRIEHAQVYAEISNGQGQISGGFTAATAQALADKINAGSLPFSLTTNNYSSISPTLGKTALNTMVWAGMVAFILICLFMVIYYRLPGLFACIALVGHLAGTLLAISWPQFTLTLPGIAGVILSIGMGVDCNIITFERIKEELRLGKDHRRSDRRRFREELYGYLRRQYHGADRRYHPVVDGLGNGQVLRLHAGMGALSSTS